MPDIDPLTVKLPAAEDEPDRPFLETLAMPFFVFTAVLTSLLLASAVFLLPVLTRVEVGGVARGLSQVRAYHTQLTGELRKLEEDRDRAILPVDDAAYEKLKARRARFPTVAQMRDEIMRAAGTLVPEEDAVHIASFAFDDAAGTLTLDGDVRNVMTRSMTVLAQFTDELRRLSFVTALTQPTFAREEDPVIGMHSPFRITLTLR